MRLETIRAGRIVSVHGIRGELRVMPWNQDPEFLTRFQTFYLNGRPVTPVSCRVHKGMVLVKISGVEDRTAAGTLRGQDLYIRREDADLGPGEYFDDELLGLDVYNGETGECIGELTKVETYPASKVYTIQGVREYLVPAVKDAFILSVDLEANRMDIRVWEGL